MRFVRVDEGDIKSSEVTLGLRRDDEGKVYGRVVAMLMTHSGPTPEFEDFAPVEAVAAASKLALAHDKSHVEVVDPDGLWDGSWGSLEQL